MVPKVGFEPTRPCGHYALNVARLPFRHFGGPLDGGRYRARTCDLFRVKEALVPTELTALSSSGFYRMGVPCQPETAFERARRQA